MFFGETAITIAIALVADFFSYFEDPVVGSQETEFLELFTNAGRERFLDRVGGLDGFRLAAARGSLGDEFLWPGKFQSFTLGLGRILAPIEYDASPSCLGAGETRSRFRSMTSLIS